MDFENLKLTKAEHVAWVTIDHPPANTWNLATMSEFEEAIGDLEADADVRVLVVTGAGDKCFSAGFDVTDAANSAIISPKGRSVWQRIDRFPKPVIAAINGHALGGGLELALACHFRMAVDHPAVKIGLTELNLGIIPGWGGTQRLPAVVGRSRALDMILMGRTLDPAAALRAGLVDRLSAPGEFAADVREFARQLAERPPVAVRCTLKAMSVGVYEGIERGLEVEAEGSEIVRATEDRREGFQAFLEKRRPRFLGR